ncbi:MAG TPA: hypothetical protein PK280_09690 [Planctomycetota bacterium]|nr:hypothetical protein [Planctomycetota bacterium]
MGQDNDSSLEKAKELSSQAHDCLRKQDYEGALALAKEIEALRYSAAYEIAGLAHSAMGNTKLAVEALERGVKKVPEVWLNWELLGNCLSDLGRYDEAAAAYEHAHQCPHVSHSYVYLNQAILAGRRGKHSEALANLDKVDDPSLRLGAAATRIRALECLGNRSQAVALAEKILTDEVEDDKNGSLSYIAAILGRMRLQLGQPKRQVRDSAFGALRHSRISDELLSLIREIDNLSRPASQNYRLLIHVRMPKERQEPAGIKGYYVTYHVMAESQEQALAFAREFEEWMGPCQLEVSKSEVIGKTAGGLLGVCFRSARSGYWAE